MPSNAPTANSFQLRKEPSQDGRLKQKPNPELDKAQADLARLQSEVAAREEANERLRADLARNKHNNKVRLRIVAVVMMVAALVRLAWVASQDTPAPAAQTVSLPPPSASVSAPPANHSSASLLKGIDGPGAKALDRLRDAFQSMPDEDQVDLIAKINAKNPNGPPACPLTWKDGIPSLSLGDKQGASPSMAAALNQCAGAVEKYRIEKAALGSN